MVLVVESLPASSGEGHYRQSWSWWQRACLPALGRAKTGTRALGKAPAASVTEYTSF